MLVLYIPVRCRDQCKSRPAEFYKIKDLVGTAAVATGEAIPGKVVTVGYDMGEPWGRFFGKKLWS